MIKTSQKSGKIQIPAGKKVAVTLCVEFEGQTVFMLPNGLTLPALASYGELDATMLLPRVLDVLEKHNIKATFFIPGHCVKTFPTECRDIVARGHEVGCQGYDSRNLLMFESEAEEEQSLLLALDALDEIGVKPAGFRSPSCTVSEHTLNILEKHGFQYDNSLMGNDLNPYYPRPIVATEDGPFIFGEPSKILEIPTSLHLDDYPFYETIGVDLMLPHFDADLPNELESRVIDTFDYASRFEGSMMAITIHTQTAGQRARIEAFSRLLDILEEKGAWFVTCKELADSVIPESFQ